MCGNVHMDTCNVASFARAPSRAARWEYEQSLFPRPHPRPWGSTSTDPTAKVPSCASWSATVVTYYTHRERHHAITRVCASRVMARDVQPVAMPPARVCVRRASRRVHATERPKHELGPEDANAHASVVVVGRQSRTRAFAHTRGDGGEINRRSDDDDGTTRRDVGGRCRVPRSARGRVNARATMMVDERQMDLTHATEERTED